MSEPETRQIDAVLWDFGGVFSPSPFAAIRDYAASIGIEAEVITEAMFGPMHDTPDHPWHRLERGEAKLTEAVEHTKEALAAHGVDFSIREMFSRMGDMASGAGDRTKVRERAEELRDRGFRQCIVTNNLAEFREMWRGTMPVDEIFDDVVDSHEVGLRKPDPAIYHLAAERTGVPLARTAFLDDLPANVDAASALGCHGILVGEDPASALVTLAKLTG